MENEGTENNLFNLDLSSLEALSQDLEIEDRNNPAEPPENNLEEQGENDNNIDSGTNDELQDPLEEQDPKEEPKGLEDEKEDPSSKKTTDPSMLAPYAKLLAEEGVLPNEYLENFDGSVESLIEAQRSYYEETVNSQINSYKENLDPRIKWLQDNIEAGVPLEELLQIEKSSFTLNNITETSLKEDIDIQKQIVRDFYKKTTKFSDNYIEREINRMDNLGELEEDSLEFLGKLKEINQEEEEALRVSNQQRLEDNKKAQEKVLQDFQDNLEKTNEIIPGLRVNDKIKDSIFKTLTTPVAVDENGVTLNKISKARLENPVDFEIKLAYIYEVTKGFSDWSALTSSGRKAAYDEFEKSAQSLDLESRGNYKGSNQNLGGNRESSFMKNLEEYSSFLKQK